MLKARISFDNLKDLTGFGFSRRARHTLWTVERPTLAALAIERTDYCVASGGVSFCVRVMIVSTGLAGIAGLRPGRANHVHLVQSDVGEWCRYSRTVERETAQR